MKIIQVTDTMRLGQKRLASSNKPEFTKIVPQIFAKFRFIVEEP